MTTIVPTIETKDSAKLETALATATKTENLNPTATATNPPPPAEKTLTSDLKEKVVTKDDTDIKPEKPTTREIATKNLIASTLVRFPLIPRLKVQTSTFTPTAFNYYEVIHMMDKLMLSNSYFARTGLPWHALVSRIYFAVVFYIQTFRAMEYAKLGSRQTRLLISQILKDLPPEKLPVPGPLMPILKALCCTRPEDPHFSLVCPLIPDNPGPRLRPNLLSPNSSMLAIPNIPMMLGLAQTILEADPNNIPDYLTPATFDDTAAHEFNGYLFPAGNWNQEMRSLICQPGMHHRPETNRLLDFQFNASGANLALPDIGEDDELYSLLNFTQLDKIDWVENLLPTMAMYSTFFKDSGNLGQCAPFGPTCPLVRSQMTTITSATAADNIALTATSAFPGIYPYSLIYDHRSYEMHIPQPYAAMAEFASINTMCNYRRLNTWSRINVLNNGRYGSYWNQNPSTLRCAHDTGMSEINDIVSNYYYIQKP